MKKVLKTIRGKIAVLLAVVPLLLILEIFIADTLSTNEKWAAVLAILVLCLVPAVILWVSGWRYVKAPLGGRWAQWDGRHDVPPQQKRMKRAARPKFYAVSIDRDMGTASFQDEHRYRTTLTYCSCPDYQKRHLPCKHMYYLAHELGIQDLPDGKGSAQSEQEYDTND